MTARFRRVALPWESQPQENVGADWSIPGLRSLYNAATHSIDVLGTVYPLDPASKTLVASTPGQGYYYPKVAAAATYLPAGSLTDGIFTRIAVVTWFSSRSNISGTGTVGGVALEVTATGELLLTKDNIVDIVLTGAGTVASGETFVFGASWDGSTAKVFKNGVLVGSAAFAAGFTVGSVPRLGLHSGSVYPWDGVIYAHADFNVALSEQQILEYSSNIWKLAAPSFMLVPIPAGGVIATTSLSAAIRAEGFQPTSLSAAIQAAQSAAASISAAVQAARTASASVDSAIQTQQTAAATVNSAIQVATSVQSALDAVLQIARTQSSSVNSAILESHTDSASLNAYIQAGFTASASVSSAIQAVSTGDASLDAVIQQALSGNASVSAAVLASLTTNATVSAAVQQALSLTAAISAAVQVAGSASASLNTYIQAGTSVGALISAAILEAKSATASLDSVISLSGAVSTSLSAVISSQLAISVATSAAIQDLRSAAATLSAYITDPLAVITNSEWWMYDMPVNDLSFDMPVNDLRYDF